MTNRNQTTSRRHTSVTPKDNRRDKQPSVQTPRASAARPNAPRGRTNTARAAHRWSWWTTGPIAIVVLVVLTLLSIAMGSRADPGASPLRIAANRALGSGAVPAPAALQDAVTSVDPATLRTVGVPAGLSGPTRIPARRAPLDGSNGKPEVLYVGAEYCPYCAAQRWALVVALSQFGSFTSLKETHSSSSDIYPDTPTLSFYGSTFTSPDLDFAAVELASNQAVGGRYRSLETLSEAQQSVLDIYDRAPYTSQAGAIPFIDVDNRFVMIGASYDPGILQGKSVAQIAQALSHPSSPVAQAVDGTANLLVGAISHATGVPPNR